MSTLSDRIAGDLKEALRAKDQVTLTVLRSLKSAIKYAELEPGAAPTSDDASEMLVLRKQIKQRQDSLASFVQGGRQDLADKESAEIAILEKYLPPTLSAERIAQLVEETIKDLGASTKKDMGAVMKELQTRTNGAVDNKTLSQAVQARLT